MVQVSEVTLDRTTNAQNLRGRIDGRELTFQVPLDVALTARGEPFLGVALLLAMSRGETLSFEPSAPLDPKLLVGLPLLQSILIQWISGFSRVAIACREQPLQHSNPGVLASFSGGVDSSFTLIDHLGEITHLLTLNAFDVGSQDDAFTPLKTKVAATAQALSKAFIPVETNARQVCEDFSISWNLAHGPVLCLIGASLGFSRLYIPSSYTYRDLKPWGSHAVLDPLWGTAATEVVYDGAHRSRTQKTEQIATNPVLLGQLQVCWNSQVENCGRCSKCVRTMLVLETLGVSGAPFPPARLDDLIAGVTLKTDLSAAFGVDLRDFFTRHGRPDLADRINRRLRRFRIRQQARRFVREVVGPSRMTSLRRRWKPGEEIKAIRIIDPDDQSW